MTKEEFIEFIATDEGKTLLEEQKKPLDNKNTELLGKMDAMKTALAELQQKEQAAVTKAVEERSSAAKQAAEAAATNHDTFGAYKQFHEDEMAKVQKTIDGLKSTAASAEVNRQVVAAAAKHSSTPKPLELLLRDRVRSSYSENGAIQIDILDEIGGDMFHNGVKATMDNLVEVLKADGDNAAFFKASGAKGSGSNMNDQKPNTGNPEMGDEGFNLTEAMGNKKF